MDRTKLWELSTKVGGLFKLTVLLQKRIRELVNGAPKLVDTPLEDYIQIALMEVEQDKISLEDLTDEELKSEEEAEGEGEAPARNPLKDM
jgi:DNA-directed RNA polymerase subunit K/omega